MSLVSRVMDKICMMGPFRTAEQQAKVLIMIVEQVDNAGLRFRGDFPDLFHVIFIQLIIVEGFDGIRVGID